MYKLSVRSLKNLEGVQPDLVAVVKRAIELTTQDFTVVEGVRSIEQQRRNVAKGVSKTMHSYHLVHEDGYGHAVDLYPYCNDSVQCDAPLSRFREIKDAMFAAAKELGVRLTWGADWNHNGRTDDERFVDDPHFQYEGSL